MDTVGTTKTVGQKLSIKNMHHETADITVESFFKSISPEKFVDRFKMLKRNPIDF